MTVYHLMVGLYNLPQIPLPHIMACHLIQNDICIGRQFLAIFHVIPCNDITEQVCRLSANVALSVEHQFIEKAQRHLFLLLRHISEIFRKNIQVGAGIFPVTSAPRRLQNIAK